MVTPACKSLILLMYALIHKKNGARMPGQSTIGRVASARCSRSRAAFVKYNGHSGLTGGATNFRQRTTLPVTSSISSINSSAIAVTILERKAHLPFRFTQTRYARALYGKQSGALSGYLGLGDAKSRSTLNERALGIGRHIFGGHFTFPITQPRDARALYAKWAPCRGVGLDPKTAKHLDGLARGDRSRADRPRRLKPGTVLLREYHGERHTVTVVAKGYVWREATYASLSGIARAITGTSWNGPRFFGLRIDKGTMVSPIQPTRGRERPTGDI